MQLSLPNLNELNLNTFMIFVSTRKNVVAAGALIVTACILIFLAVGQVSQALEVRSNVLTEQERVQQLNTKVQELEQLRVSPQLSQMEEIHRILPSHKPLLELLNNLNAVAGESGVSIVSFEISPGEIASDSTQVQENVNPRRRNADYDQLELELTVTGGLDQVRSFMEFIERVSPITTITRLTIDRGVQGSGRSGNDITRATLALNTYYYTKSISSTLASPLPQISQAEQGVFQAILDFTPPNLEEQTTVITGNNTDLFGIGGLNVSDLEENLATQGIEE